MAKVIAKQLAEVLLGNIKNIIPNLYRVNYFKTYINIEKFLLIG